MKKLLAQKLATLVDARLTCIDKGNEEWEGKHEDQIEKLISTYLSTDDNMLNFDKSTGSQRVITCIDNGNSEWENKVESLILNCLPTGNKLNFNKSTGARLVFNGAYHLMNDGGFYVGWIDYRVVVTASLMFGIDVNVIGPFSDAGEVAIGLKEYLVELYVAVLTQTIEA